MKTYDIEIYNFLNLTSHRFGRLYKYTGYSPLPKGFVIDTEKIKEKLFLSQMKNEKGFPPFIEENKIEIKKSFKILAKNCKKIAKKVKNYNFSKEFNQNFEIYLEMISHLASVMKRDFSNQGFDEVEAYREVYNINPIFGELLSNIFENDADFDVNLKDLENKYNLLYAQKLKLIAKKQTKKQEKLQKAQSEINNLILQKEQKNVKNSGKNLDKTAKNTEKLKNKQEAEKTREKNKKSKTTSNKEK